MSISHYSYKYGHGSKEFSLESDRVIKDVYKRQAYKSGHHVWTLEEDAKEDKEDADLHH